MICDPDLDFLEKHISLIDAELQRIGESARSSPEEWVKEVALEDAESLLGLGFAACQRYITATCGWQKVPKHKALKIGGAVAGGMSGASIINHAANYWKHHDEWAQAPTVQKQRTLDAMRSIDALDTEFPMMVVLATLTERTTLSPALDHLIRWRDELRTKRPNQSLEPTAEKKSRNLKVESRKLKRELALASGG